MRLIDADTLKNVMTGACNICDGQGIDTTIARILISIIDNVPTIDTTAVEPIRSKNADVWYCGNCDEIVGEETLTVGGIQEVRHKYCPECGRKVKWE